MLAFRKINNHRLSLSHLNFMNSLICESITKLPVMARNASSPVVISPKAEITYTYNCPICGLIQQFTRPGIYKCPRDGSVMFLKL
jgi:hypothetical protein